MIEGVITVSGLLQPLHAHSSQTSHHPTGTWPESMKDTNFTRNSKPNLNTLATRDREMGDLLYLAGKG